MLDAATLMRWTLVPSLALAGARIALGSLRASPSSVRLARAASVLTVLLAAVGLAAGLRRIPELPRAAHGIGQARFADIDRENAARGVQAGGDRHVPAGAAARD